MIAAIFSGMFCSYLDVVVSRNWEEPPLVWTTTTESAQSFLSTVASATISFAGTTFSVSLLVIQLASTQYSPRVVHTLFKDPFYRRVVALVVGTFTYCLVVMRSLGDPENQRVDPNVSVAVAFILGIASVLAIVAFIDHAANTMDISKLLERITRDTIWHIQQTWELPDTNESKGPKKSSRSPSLLPENPSGDTGSDEDGSEIEEKPQKQDGKKGEEAEAQASAQSLVVRFNSSGWVQEIDYDTLLEMVPAGGVMKVYITVGRYAIPETAACSIAPKPSGKNFKEADIQQTNQQSGDIEESEDNEEFLEDFESSVLDSFIVGPSRTMRCDPSFGLRQLVDVILRALSPGVNDPTTAQDGIFHVAAVVTEFCRHKIPESTRTNDRGGRIILYEQHDYDSIVRLGFDEVRCYCSSSPAVALYLLESLRLIRESLQACGYSGRAPEIERQARLITEGIQNNSGNTQEDRERILKAKKDRFDRANPQAVFVWPQWVPS